MAFMNQSKKKVIKAALDEVVPAEIKYSLAVDNHSTIVMTIKSAPIDLIEILADGIEDRGNAERADYIRKVRYYDLNVYHMDKAFVHFSERLQETFDNILKALNTGNWDKSDIMTDYFDVGHYVDLRIGSWKKPFEVK